MPGLVRASASVPGTLAAIPGLLSDGGHAAPAVTLASGAVCNASGCAGHQFLLAARLGLLLVGTLSLAAELFHASASYAAHDLGFAGLGRSGGSDPRRDSDRQRRGRRGALA